ncbi:16333_t:CDS:1, partial [Racocetra fulgida]
QLHSSILNKRKYEEIEKAKGHYKRICLVAPVQPYEEDRTQELSESSSSNEIQLSTLNSLVTEQNEVSETINNDIIDDFEEYWFRMIENWIGILDTENNEEAMNYEIPEFEFGEHIIHPAEDPEFTGVI